ncbi:MAG: hypothetical protein ACRELY_14585 [Polyangiaceae bacterium]
MTTHDARRTCALSHLAGNGAMLVRERAIARTVQTALERLYRIDDGTPVDPFVSAAGEHEREALLVRENEDGLEIALRIPKLEDTSENLDALCQIIEGVSHFVMIAERARLQRATSHLELEMQAEVDKYVVLAAATASREGALDVAQSMRLRERLYDAVSFVHSEASEIGMRYRTANRAAARFVRRIEREYFESRRIDEMRENLRRFFAGNQEEKLRLAAA